MVKICCNNVSKHFNHNYIIKNFSYEFSCGVPYVIKGNNGAGKSTLLQLLMRIIDLNQGAIDAIVDKNHIASFEFYKKFSVVAPYIGLPMHLTVEECISFYFKIKPPKIKANFDNTYQQWLNEAHLQHKKNTLLTDLSNGMLQRLKLLLAFYADVPFIFLDEPCTFLDQQGVEWYQHLIQNTFLNQLVIVASNNKEEFNFSHETIVL